jgi:hypothetical protein
MILLILGGFITLQLVASGPDSLLPVRVQTLNPQASTLEATSGQALGFFIFAVVAVGSLIGGGLLLSFVLRFLDREITSNRGQ